MKYFLADCNCSNCAGCFPGQIQPRPMLSAGISLNQIIDAMTDPNKRLNFPMKPIETKIDLAPETKTVIIGAAALLALGLIAVAATRNTR